ncbi:MAG TPA: efflux RND transporter periplasmic adaptor subunit [Pirellulales bacterium]|jgi:cobalt-zinc-cadmium efflux system membrane fusion protein|nr:efflux RND transporter periplasmic adaptor subunit [Pirellulales bacterium]
MRNRNNRRGRILRTLFFVLGLCGAGLLFLSLSSSLARHGSAKDDVPPSMLHGVRLVPGTTDSLELSAEAVHSLDIHTYEVLVARNHEHLRFAGSLFLDPNRLARVHSRFPGEVVSIGPVKPGADLATDPVGGRPLRAGDRVEQGQVLAVIWSKDVGEKKSDLVNALSQYVLDQAQLERLKALDPGVVNQKTLKEAQHDVEFDTNAVERYERTLRSWRLTEDEIAAVRAEADRIHRGDREVNVSLEKTWAEVDVRAPFAGVVLEKNITTGDIIDTDLDLFKVGDLARLGVMADVYEEDLPALESLGPNDRKWTLHLTAQPMAPAISGTFDLISNTIDPKKHTAALLGWLDNADGRLRVGQFITATVDLPTATDEVAIPESAVLDEGPNSIVFVSTDASCRQVTQRTVAVSRRGQDFLFVQTHPSAAELHAGCQPLLPGEYVVTAGALELATELDRAVTPTAPAEESVH